MALDFNESGVLLGLAEVKVPFKNLCKGERETIVHICYRQLLEIKPLEHDSKEEHLKCIGVVDSFYALQEVRLAIDKNTCRIFRKAEVILQYGLSDVMVTMPAADCSSRIIIVSQTPAFGKTALVLQMRSKDVVHLLVKKLSAADHKAKNDKPDRSNGKQRSGADSFGKTVGKKMNNLLNTFTSAEKNSQESCVSAPEENTSADSPTQSEDDDDLNSDDSDEEDDIDSASDQQFLLNASHEPRPSFDRQSMSALEAEIEYLIQSEISFVCSLRRVLGYKATLYNATDLVKKKHTDQMLLYIHELYDFHKNFLDELKNCKGDNFGLLSTFKTHLDDFRVHVLYISNIPIAEKIYNLYFQTFKQTNPTLGEDLRKPRMRLNHYILTFESLKKVSEEDNLSIIMDIIEIFKAYLKEADTRLITDSIILCPFNLMDYGFLSMNGELSLKRGAGLVKRRYQVLLLDQILVLAKGTQNVVEYVSSYALATSDLVHEMRGVLVHLTVQRNGKPMLLVFKAKTIKLQQKWIEQLKYGIDKAKENKEERSKANNYQSDEISKNLSFQTYSQASFKNENNETLSLTDAMPPLTITMAFHKFTSRSLSKKIKDNLNLFVRIIQDSEKLLLKNIEHVLSQNNFQNDLNAVSTDVRHLYEFHLRYFYPAIAFTKDKFEYYVSKQIVTKRKDFVGSSARMLFLAVILKFESKRQYMSSIFEVVVDNFCKYKLYFSTVDVNADNPELQKTFCEARKVLEESISLANFHLKQRYISKFSASEKCVTEGFLSIKEVPEGFEDNTYVILTKENVYFLSASESKYKICDTFQNNTSKLGHPVSINSFTISFKEPLMLKRRFTFTAPDIDTKNMWISKINDVFPPDLKRGEIIRTSAVRRRVNPESSGSSGNNEQKEGLSLPVSEKTGTKNFHAKY